MRLEETMRASCGSPRPKTSRRSTGPASSASAALRIASSLASRNARCWAASSAPISSPLPRSGLGSSNRDFSHASQAAITR